MSLALPWIAAWLTIALSAAEPSTPAAKPRRKLNNRRRHPAGCVRLDAGQPLFPQLARV